MVWDSSEKNDELSDLALELDLYEADPVSRKQQPVYYGEDCLYEKVERTIGKLKGKNSE